MKTPREESKLEQIVIHWDDIICDKCGRQIDPEACEGDAVGHEMQIWLNPQQCVNFYRGRDYCDDCCKPIWEAINSLIGANPDEEREPE
jgi:hypothetical protein